MMGISWLGILYDFLGQARVFGYKKQVFKTVHLPVPVVSVGNLTVGGTGKTPVMDLILTHYESLGISVGLVSRSYKAKMQNPSLVDLQNTEKNLLFGDEPVWLKEKHPRVPVMVGPSKWRSAEALLKKSRLQVLCVDDGYQHLKLARNLNILLLDLSQDLKHYGLLPLGRARENIQASDRADFILFTKSDRKNLQTEEKFHQLGLFKKKHGILSQELDEPRPLQIKQSNSWSNKSKILAVCGLADPRSFGEMLRRKYPTSDIIDYSFPDHHQYTLDDLKDIFQRAKGVGAGQIAITEKDAGKIETLFESKSFSAAIILVEAIPIWIFPLKLQFVSGAQDFRSELEMILVGASDGTA